MLSFILARNVCRAARSLEKCLLLWRINNKAGETPPGPVVWFHTSSTGECAVVLPVIFRCLAAYSQQVPLLVTTTTPTCFALLRAALPARVVLEYAPKDRLREVLHFLSRWQPLVAIFIETASSHHLIQQARNCGAKLVLLNAGMDEQTFLHWHSSQSRRRYLRRVLACFQLIIPQSNLDVSRFCLFGVSFSQMPGWCNDLKYAAAMAASLYQLWTPTPEQVVALRIGASGRPLWVAAELHEGEEELVGRVHQRLVAEWPGLLTVLAPWEGACCAAVREKLRAMNLKVASWGETPQNFTSDILLVHSPRALPLFYAVSEIVFMGNSLLPQGSGHNLAEAAVAGCAVVVGAQAGSFTHMAEELNQAAVAAAEEAAAAVHRTRPLDEEMFQAQSPQVGESSSGGSRGTERQATRSQSRAGSRSRSRPASAPPVLTCFSGSLSQPAPPLGSNVEEGVMHPRGQSDTGRQDTLPMGGVQLEGLVNEPGSQVTLGLGAPPPSAATTHNNTPSFNSPHDTPRGIYNSSPLGPHASDSGARSHQSIRQQAQIESHTSNIDSTPNGDIALDNGPRTAASSVPLRVTFGSYLNIYQHLGASTTGGTPGWDTPRTPTTPVTTPNAGSVVLGASPCSTPGESPTCRVQPWSRSTQAPSEAPAVNSMSWGSHTDHGALMGLYSEWANCVGTTVVRCGEPTPVHNGIRVSLSDMPPNAPLDPSYPTTMVSLQDYSRCHHYQEGPHDSGGAANHQLAGTGHHGDRDRQQSLNSSRTSENHTELEGEDHDRGNHHGLQVTEVELRPHQPPVRQDTPPFLNFCLSGSTTSMPEGPSVRADIAMNGETALGRVLTFGEMVHLVHSSSSDVDPQILPTSNSRGEHDYDLASLTAEQSSNMNRWPGRTTRGAETVIHLPEADTSICRETADCPSTRSERSQSMVFPGRPPLCPSGPPAGGPSEGSSQGLPGAMKCPTLAPVMARPKHEGSTLGSSSLSLRSLPSHTSEMVSECSLKMDPLADEPCDSHGEDKLHSSTEEGGDIQALDEDFQRHTTTGALNNECMTSTMVELQTPGWASSTSRGGMNPGDWPGPSSREAVGDGTYPEADFTPFCSGGCSPLGAQADLGLTSRSYLTDVDYQDTPRSTASADWTPHWMQGSCISMCAAVDGAPTRAPWQAPTRNEGECRKLGARDPEGSGPGGKRDPFLDSFPHGNAPSYLRYLGEYILPATHLPYHPHGPAVWQVRDETGLVTAVGTLLREPLERRSRGHAAAQAAAKLASGLVNTVWQVLDDHVISPTLKDLH